MNAGADERERFNFTMFLSVAVHGILIFGISFGAVQSTSEVPTLEITLAAHHSEIAPNRADFLAQANQLGSGSLAEDAPAVAPTLRRRLTFLRRSSHLGCGRQHGCQL